MMHEFARIAGFTVALALVFHSPARADGTTNDPKPIQLTHASPKNIAPLLAKTCAPASWGAFADWAKSVGFSSLKFKEVYEITTSRNSFRVTADGSETAELKIDSKGALEMTISSQSAAGADACALILAIGKKDVKFDSAIIAAAIGGTYQVSLARSPADLASISAAILLSLDANKRGTAKLDLSRVLDANYSMKCNEALSTIQTPTHKIVVRHGTKPSFDVFDKDTDISVILDRQSAFAMKAGQYLMAMTKNCKKSKDASALVNIANDTHEDALAQASGLEETAARLPASK